MTNVQARKFNENGQSAFIQLLQEQPEDLVHRVEVLSVSESHTEMLNVEIDLRPVVTRKDIAEHMHAWFQSNPAMNHLMGSSEFWDWLSAAWMKVLVQSDPRYLEINSLEYTKAKRIIGKQFERWALTEGSDRYHRHLIANPYFSLIANLGNPSAALCLLESNICEPGELVERIAGKSKFNSGTICHLATLLYVDLNTGRRRPGYTSSPGNPKSFSYYFTQIDLTVDYQSMTVTELLDLLPDNFSSRVVMARKDFELSQILNKSKK